MNARDHIWTEQNSFQTEIGMCQQLGKVPLAPKIEVGDQISNPEKLSKLTTYSQVIFFDILDFKIERFNAPKCSLKTLETLFETLSGLVIFLDCN